MNTCTLLMFAFAHCSLLVICQSCLIATYHRTSPNNDVYPVHHFQTRSYYSDLPMAPCTMPHAVDVIQCRDSRLTSALTANSLISVQPCNSPVNLSTVSRNSQARYCPLFVNAHTRRHFLNSVQAPPPAPGQASSWCLRLQLRSHDRPRRHLLLTCIVLRLLHLEWSPALRGDEPRAAI